MAAKFVSSCRLNESCDAHTFFKTPQYWSTRDIARQSQRCTGVSEMDTPFPPFRPLSVPEKTPKNKGCDRSRTLSHPRDCSKKLPGH